MTFKGAGGTQGGTGAFLTGLVMMVGGAYLLLREIIVRPDFGSPFAIIGGFPLTTGMVFIPFLFGVGMIFYNRRSLFGWGLTLSALVMLVFGVIASLHIRLATMSAFDLVVILVLLVGGIGLFLRSLRSYA